MKNFIQEFKSFAVKGNVIDLAVAVVIGGAFGKIVTSLVNDIIMPIIGIISGGIDLTGLAVTIGTVSLTYGNFIQSIVDFVIIALCIFIAVKMINRFNRKEKKKEQEKEMVPSQEAKLLEEIRDLLKEK
jgi:large conductance mechanosensitive channel